MASYYHLLNFQLEYKFHEGRIYVSSITVSPNISMTIVALNKY